MQENMVVIRESKMFYFNFELLKDINDNLKYETEFMIKTMNI